MTRLYKVALFGLPAICGFALAPVAFANGDPAHKDAMFDKMDSNGDGKISADEHAAGAKKMFEKMDADKNGQVTAAEMDAAHDKMMGKAKTAEHKAEMSSADKIKMIDTNDDGMISAAEHEAGSKMMFDKMDTDHDGFLTKAEFEAGHEKWMKKDHAK
jgi:Ca2+-binding EF-hand superfamily protein